MASAACRTLCHCGPVLSKRVAQSDGQYSLKRKGLQCRSSTSPTKLTPVCKHSIVKATSEQTSHTYLRGSRSHVVKTKVVAAAGGEEGVTAKSVDKAQLLRFLKDAIETVSRKML
jgi:hypothetical protein